MWFLYGQALAHRRTHSFIFILRFSSTSHEYQREGERERNKRDSGNDDVKCGIEKHHSSGKIAIKNRNDSLAMDSAKKFNNDSRSICIARYIWFGRGSSL